MTTPEPSVPDLSELFQKTIIPSGLYVLATQRTFCSNDVASIRTGPQRSENARQNHVFPSTPRRKPGVSFLRSSAIESASSFDFMNLRLRRPQQPSQGAPMKNYNDSNRPPRLIGKPSAFSERFHVDDAPRSLRYNFSSFAAI